MRNMPAPKRARLERQQTKRARKEERRTEKRAPKPKLTPEEELEKLRAAEKRRCDKIAGHSTTREERDAIRQREVRELVAILEAGRQESDRITAARKAAKAA